MSRVQTKQTLKLRLLALVLALALIWYSLNPVSTPIVRRKRDDELPDEKKRNVEPHTMPANLLRAFRPPKETAKALPSLNEDEDDFEWPEFIDG
ncbi:MAG: hypothetical protein QOJ02_1862 [Acidobacteriota bacterium]|jgi:hypothetical protein|nr:hypothetical protein [Acidobacteriota bacterium]